MWSVLRLQAIYFSYRIRPPESLLTLNERNVPFVSNVKYLGVIFDKKITERSHIETIEAKAFREFITTYSLLKNKRLSTDIITTFHKAFIRSVKTYACPAWKFEAGTHLLILQRLQNKILAPFTIFQGTRRSENCLRLAIFRTFTTSYAGNKQNSYKIMKIRMSAI
jgi:hypothetical protein